VTRFSGRVVIVTGAARGLGRDYARFFAADGAQVVLADVSAAGAATADAEGTGARCMALDVDVRSRTSVALMVDRTIAEFGKVDVLVNNAGLWRGLHEAGLLGCPDDVWRAAWDVNVTGSLHCYQAVVPGMIERGWGRVINISSMAAVHGGDAYGLTKATVELMTSGMAREVGDSGVTVNCIAPGISAFAAASGRLDEADRVIAGNVIRRMGTSRELYEAMAYLCSDAASYITGQTLHVDGGGTLR
jgi:NAD(P)-dependent dehydrogenase (short-subunit alcohol dehydrogenase family)